MEKIDIHFMNKRKKPESSHIRINKKYSLFYIALPQGQKPKKLIHMFKKE